MTDDDRERWNQKYDGQSVLSTTAPDEWLIEAVEHIRREHSSEQLHRAVDLACGLGQNSIWMAQQGLDVDAVDISERGLQLASEFASANDADVQWITADFDQWQPTSSRYDIAVVFRFLDRISTPRIVREGLRLGGWLIYETFSNAQCDRADSHIRNPDYTLKPGELSETMFPDFDVIVDREDVLADRTVERLLARRVR